jgi:AcrR family transcriptional regulator
MVQVVHKGENKAHLNAILKAGYHHFSLYGYSKTTMKDIASQLGLSKGSLYYYFQDKEALYKAIVEESQLKFLCECQQKFQEENGIPEKLEIFVKLKLAHFRSMLNMNQLRSEEFQNFRPMMQELWSKLKHNEIDLIENVFIQGVKDGELTDSANRQSAEIFTEVLKGLRNIHIAYKTILFLEEEEYKIIEEKSLQFVAIFIKGLSS